MEFQWSLYSYDDINMPEPYNLSDLNVISENKLKEMAFNPTDQLDLAIKPYSLQTAEKYTFAFRATRPSGVYGEVRNTMLVNDPPANGETL